MTFTIRAQRGIWIAPRRAAFTATQEYSASLHWFWGLWGISSTVQFFKGEFMRRLFEITAVLGLSAVAMACNGSSKNDQPGSNGQDARGPAWTVKLQSTCLNPADDQCVGKYGFSVDADGKYQAGPHEGQVRTGTLTAEEMSELNSKLAPVLAITNGLHTENVEDSVENNGDDAVILVRQNKEDKVSYNLGAEFHYATNGVGEAQALHKAIRDLANSYYRLPFGNECSLAVDKVEALYAPAQTCQSDFECVYVDATQGYEVVPPRSTQYLYTEDCRAVKPLTVANQNNIHAASAAILDAYATAVASCGQQFYRASCYTKQAQTVTAPVCVQNRCQARL
jgi:hypothetical protein